LSIICHNILYKRMHAKNQIANIIQKITGQNEIHLEVPERQEFGDYSTNVAMRLFVKGKDFPSPRDLAEDLLKKIQEDGELLKITDKIAVAGSGFINFWLKKEILYENLTEIIQKNRSFGESDLLTGKKIMIEFAHPNTHKLFHIGHLRNITTGESLARILENAGAKVIRVNYQGDVGLHIAKAMWVINKYGYSDSGDVQKRAEFLGKAYMEGNRLYEESEEAKEEVHKINEALYKGEDKKLMDLYKETRSWSLDYFDFIYKRVDTKFERFYFESEVAGDGYKLSKEALEKGILKESEGAVIFPGNEYGLHDRVFITQRDVLTYEGKDMGLAKLQFKEFDPDLLIHLVGPEQTDYFKVVFKALELILPETKEREKHLSYGWVRLKEGKMSSRTGNVVSGNWLLDEAKLKLTEKYKSDSETAEKVAVAAVKYSFLKNSLNQEIAFDINESISLEGNSGPYIQYTYARTQSVIEKSEVKKEELKKLVIRDSLDINPEERSLLRTLLYYPEITESAAAGFSPNLLCNYLYELAQKFNVFYNKHRILDADSSGKTNKDITDFRLSLTDATGSVIKSGLYLLGIQSPDKM